MPAMPAALLYDQRAEIQGLTQKLRKGIITSSEHVKNAKSYTSSLLQTSIRRAV